MTIALDWNAIRLLNGSKADGFEELCAQLARTEIPLDSCFERKGTPDAGVECYTVLENGSEWGWQAKYIDNLGEAQWPQLDNSVKTALEKHPRLVRYFICAPLDRPDARIEGRRSAMQRWDDHVKKWTGWAADRDMAVEFVWWGSSELLDRLSHPKHIGHVYFWFDVRGFDDAWFQARLDEALITAGPRYTPEIHVDLPIAAELEAFGRTDRFFDRIKALARGIRKKLQTFGYSKSKVAEPSLDALASVVSLKAQAVLNEFGAVKVQPAGILPFQSISKLVAETEAATAELGKLLLNFERKHDDSSAEAGKQEGHFSYRDNPFRECHHQLFALKSELQKTRKALEHAEVVAGSTLMLLKGAAGTGKTHLLCDVAKQRLAAGRPTVLLMGQQFVSTEPPWTQVTQQLDLPGLAAERFVSSLEAAAQVAGCRALILIDAINEGTGRLIWPSHLATFLEHLERSPWIGVVLSVRSSYEEIVVPEETRNRAVINTHQGFTDHEYDAMRTFFVHYGLELPSTPILTPEFRNPLFLKTICHGLSATGKRRLPRGFHGITATFNLYLKAINNRLSVELGVDPRERLVQRGINEFAKALVESGKRWLTLDNAKEVINALLPGRDFERSLYRGLVTEGVLVEEAERERESTHKDVVFFGYDRFADHLISKMLLDAHLDPKNPEVAFAAGGPLAFLWNRSQYVSAGLLEAMCIQIPERTGKELVLLAPEIQEHWIAGDAFLQSLVWRDTSAFSEATHKVLNAIIRSEHGLSNTLDTILTVATLPEHPLNVQYLDHWLRGDTMPDRDAWWSTYLHHTWRSHGAVDRLVDWASSVTPEANLDDEAVGLCATALSWMLTTSNRFLRDRATKALVSLLTGRLDAVERLVTQFVDVDDPYVAERIYAIAYGVATRSHDLEKIAILAECIYSQIFAKGTPPVHILLRDYARGVVERAIHLGADIEVDVTRIRPPYNSVWPTIPTEDDIKPLLPDWSRGSHESGDLEWAHNRIGSSVMDDDFAHYVIGTNSWSTNWLSLRLDEAAWQSPDERMAELVSNLSVQERTSWEEFKIADEEFKHLSSKVQLTKLRRILKDIEAAESEKQNETQNEELDSEILTTKQKRDALFVALESVLSEEHSPTFKSLFNKMNSDYNSRRPPRFDLRLIQRYILWRVFDLGWTTERFGKFDRFSIGYHGRSASKAERIGKKYQWIAYHEIMAFVADHFQYREQYCEENGDHAYDGPWQDSLRDIDPSCTLRASRGGTSLDGHTPVWWGACQFEDWGDPKNPQDWVTRQDNLPQVEDLLRTSNPNDASRWVNVQGYFNWCQQPPADQEFTDVERRDLWYICTGYLVRTQDTHAFMTWAKNVDFWGRWMPEPPKVYRMFLGEHCWSPASRCFQQLHCGDDGWKQPDQSCPVKIREISFEYINEASGFDCSIDESFNLRLPACDLVTGLGIRWTGYDADYMDSEGRLAAFDPTTSSDGPNALLIREDLLKTFLVREGLSVVWMILGEKRALGAGFMPVHLPSVQISGAYMLHGGEPDGFLNFKAESGDSDSPEEDDA